MTFEEFMVNHENRMKELNKEVNRLNQTLEENEKFFEENDKKFKESQAEIDRLLNSLLQWTFS